MKPANPPKKIMPEKKLSVVFAADIYGYSKMMHNDEERTFRMLKKARSFIDPKIKKHNGRIANTAGDSIIAVFPTASDSVECAISIQKSLRNANMKIEPSKRLILRIGLNIGDVYANGKDVLGEGVNIAARLEAQAEPGAICVSDSIYSLVYKQLEKDDYKVANLGRLHLKNIGNPVQAYEILSTKSGYYSALGNVMSDKQQVIRLLVVAIIAVGSFSVSMLIVYMFYANFININNLNLVGN